MTFVRFSLLTAVFALAGMMTKAEEPKTVAPAKLIPATKLGDSKTPMPKGDDAQKQKEDIQKSQQNYQAQLKQTQEEIEKQATHKVSKSVTIPAKDGVSLQTLAVDGEGRVLALVAPPRGFSNAQKGVTSRVHILDQDGKEIKVITVDFHASAVNAGPNGTIYIAGDGKLARFDKSGKRLGDIVELPFIAEILNDKVALRARAEKQLKDQKQSFEKMVQQYKDRVAKLETKEKEAKEKGEELTKSEATQLKQNRQLINSLKTTQKHYDSMTVESVLDGILGRVKVVNSITANEKEVFLVCGESQGYGFSLWRMGHDLKSPKKIMSGLSGCCGQMDVQCFGDDIVVAENTKHRFVRYDREGVELATGGKRGKETEPGCFGGCCNPMNIKGCGDDILTAESEGIIKRFGPTGEFRGMVGSVGIGGGCKNVAIGSNADGSRVYFCDQPGGRVFILTLKDEAKEESKGAPQKNNK